MANTEKVVDAPRKPLAPVDDTVMIPESVRRAAARAESYYKQQPKAPEPPAATAEPPAAAAPAEPVTPAEPAPPPPPTPAATPPAEPPAAAAPPAGEDDGKPVTPEQWEHRYLSMKGRYAQSQQTIGSMQEQMQEMGNELLRTQQLLTSISNNSETPPATPQGGKKLLTPEDEQAYGTELLDVVKRAAEEAISPKLEHLENENRQLRQRVTQTAQGGVYDILAREVPNWQVINRDPKFVRWLSLRDVYSGHVRKQMLGAAFQAADAPRVVAFFKGFMRDEAVASGNAGTVPLPPQPAQEPPRQAAVPLETLAAPGRPRPATGDSQMPSDKPIFTRAQIAKFYATVRQGGYEGREADKRRDEEMIFAAQREGRVRG